jgi:hypothetical protein
MHFHVSHANSFCHCFCNNNIACLPRNGATHGLQILLWSKSGKRFSGLFYKKKTGQCFSKCCQDADNGFMFLL